MAPTLPLPAFHGFIKRAQGGNDKGIDIQIPPLAVVVLCLVAALFFLLMAWGIARFFFDEAPPRMEPSALQHDYMRTVRARNLDSLLAEGHAARYGRASSRADTQSIISEAPGPSRKR